MRNHPSRQSGAVLIVSLMLLLVMTLIGVAGMQSSLLNEKMAGNFRDKDLALQTTEAALRVGEDIALAQASLSPPNTGFPAGGGDGDDTCPTGENNLCTGGLCPTPDKDCPARWLDTGFTGWTNATGLDPGGLLATNPQYFVEYLGATFACTQAASACASGPGTPGCDCKRYRVTARIPSSGNRARVMLQSVYATD